MPSSAPVAIIDTLNALLDSEVHSVFRFMGEGSPYLSRATAEVRRPLQQMVETNTRHVRELAELIEMLGGVPQPMTPGINREEQYLAFLSLKFLLPKLVEEKKLVIRRYDNAITSLRDAPPEVVALLQSHNAEHRQQLEILERASAEVIRASR